MRTRRFHNGFSLVEIVLAIGIISFALVGLLGLFPAALTSANDSQNETQAALIAESIFADLKSTSPEKAFVVTGTGFFQKNPSNGDRIAVDLTHPLSGAAPEEYCVAYNDKAEPLHAASPSTFESGDSDKNAAYLARISVSANLDTKDVPPNLSDPPKQPGISKVVVEVGTPALAPKARRKSYYFSSLITHASPPTTP